MAPVTPQKTWKEIHAKRKEYKKKWKEEKLLKKLKKSSVDHVNGETNKTALDSTAERTLKEINEMKEKIKCLRTLSIAVPGSILENAQSPELSSYLAGQIARAACIYNVDEIVVFDDKGEGNANKKKVLVGKMPNRWCLQLARILQYLECPQYLRKQLFPIHKDLQYTGVINPLNAPHHLLRDDDLCYREGIVSEFQKKNQGSYVNVGLWKDVIIDKVLTPHLRVTVKLEPQIPDVKKRYARVVPPAQPKADLGIYWGYTVRIAESLSEVLSDSPYEGGYDLTIGTSEKGISIDEIPSSSLKEHKHLLVVFGGLDGLEAALESDDKLDNVSDITLLFDKYINTCPSQGSRVIRTEEAMLISLAELRRVLY